MALSILDVKKYLVANGELATLTNNKSPYLLDVPEQDANIENLPIIRINQIADYEKDKASNKAYTKAFTCQIDVWTTKLKDIEEFEKVIDKIMEDHNYSQINGDLKVDTDFQAEQKVYMLSRRYSTTIITSTLQ